MHLIQPFIIAFAISLGLALIVTPIVTKFASLIGAMDIPGFRKVHNVPTPRLGGVALYISMFGGLFILSYFYPATISSLWISGPQGMTLLAALIVILCLGIWDDIHPLKAGTKFLVQLAVSIAIYFGGFHVSDITNIFGLESIPLGILDFPLTVLWIVGVTNALNLIDGLDGLSAGVALIASMTILPITLLQGDSGSAVLLLLLAASLIGFLGYNFYPAKIFLGDSGSLFLGFLLAVLSVKSSTKNSMGFTLLVPILALGLPIIETLLSMTRRYLRSFLEQAEHKNTITRLKSIFKPDSGHIHHRLLGYGLSHRKTVLLLYCVSILFGIGAITITVTLNPIASLILVLIGVATVIGVFQLKYNEMAMFHNGILLPLYDKPIINRQSFQVFFDIASICISFILALYLSGGMEITNNVAGENFTQLSYVIIIQLSVFWFSGMYKRAFQIISIGDVLRTMKGIFFSIIITGIILNAVTYPTEHGYITTLVMDFFFLEMFILGGRLSLHILRYLSSQSAPKGGKNVLIYGADLNGVLMLDRMIEANIPTWTPIGIIDDNPSLTGKIINGYPVLGSHWNLHNLIRKHKIDEIILCSDTIKPEALRRIEKFVKKNNISLKRMRILFEDVHANRQEYLAKLQAQLYAPHDVVEKIPIRLMKKDTVQNY